MTTLFELREQALKCQEEAENEPTLEMKRALYRRAIHLEQLAKKIELEGEAAPGSSMRRNRSG
jgi:hypothetical protein